MKKFLLQRWKSINHAWCGLRIFMKTEVHARLHLTAAVMVLFAGWIFDFSLFEWLFVIISIGLVFLAEIFNTVLERMMDFVHPDVHPEVKVIKDMAAGAVLWISFIVFIVGLILFGSRWVAGG